MFADVTVAISSSIHFEAALFDNPTPFSSLGLHETPELTRCAARCINTHLMQPIPNRWIAGRSGDGPLQQLDQGGRRAGRRGKARPDREFAELGQLSNIGQRTHRRQLWLRIVIELGKRAHLSALNKRQVRCQTYAPQQK